MLLDIRFLQRIRWELLTCSGSRSLAPEDGTDKLSRNVDDCSLAHTKVMED